MFSCKNKTRTKTLSIYSWSLHLFPPSVPFAPLLSTDTYYSELGMSSIHQQYQSCVFKICINNHTFPSFSNFLAFLGSGVGGWWCWLQGLQYPSSQTRDWTQSLCSESMESQPLDSQGIPWNFLFLFNITFLGFVLVSVNLVSAHLFYFLHNIPLFKYTTMPGTSNKGTYTDVTIYIKTTTTTTTKTSLQSPSIYSKVS